MNRGYLRIDIGPMRSGKTQRIIYKSSYYAAAGKRVLYINSSQDDSETRNTPGGDENFTCHTGSGIKLDDRVDKIKSCRLSTVDVSQYDVIFVDEWHFYCDLYDTVIHWVNVMNKHVEVSGLDGSYTQVALGDTLDLIPLADKVKKHSAICMKCMPECIAAPFTIYEGSTEIPQVSAGHTEHFISVCRYHMLH